jgi:hypothetical protein
MWAICNQIRPALDARMFADSVPVRTSVRRLHRASNDREPSEERLSRTRIWYEDLRKSRR